MPDVPRHRFSLRDLPIAAKLVVTMFLISVGVGYFSALVQIHMQHSTRNGEPMPTIDDVIEKFSGLKPFDGKVPVSKFESILSGPPDGPFNKQSMTPAFYGKSSGYEKEHKDAPGGKPAVDALRAGELAAVLAWVHAEPDARKAAYEADKFALAPGAPDVTEDFYDKGARTVTIAGLIESRCARCHGVGDSQSPPMTNYTEIEPLVSAPKPDLIAGKWQRSTRQMSVEGLTQSTHAHLLSFSMLFSLTGMAFAFTTYPVVMRAFLGPVVLLAQMLDIGCWWLARVDAPYGPIFASMIVGTGGVVGAGLGAQIVLTLFNMYGGRGKAMLGLLVLVATGVFATVVVTVIEPALTAERDKRETPAAVKAPVKNGQEPVKGKGAAPKADDKAQADAMPDAPAELPKSKE